MRSGFSCSLPPVASCYIRVKPRSFPGPSQDPASQVQLPHHLSLLPLLDGLPHLDFLCSYSGGHSYLRAFVLAALSVGILFPLVPPGSFLPFPQVSVQTPQRDLSWPSPSLHILASYPYFNSQHLSLPDIVGYVCVFPFEIVFSLSRM